MEFLLDISLQRKVILRGNKGQSTIEFVVTLTVMFGFLFSFYKLAIVYTNGYLVHYATFMASRTYMVVDNNSGSPDGSDGDAFRRAQQVFDKYSLSSLINTFDGKIKENNPSSFSDSRRNLYVGIFAEYEDKIMTPILGNSYPLRMRSDSFLGREPTRAECFFRICAAFGMVTGGGDYCQLHSTVFDNGC